MYFVVSYCKACTFIHIMKLSKAVLLCSIFVLHYCIPIEVNYSFLSGTISIYTQGRLWNVDTSRCKVTSFSKDIEGLEKNATGTYATFEHWKD